MSTRKVFFLCGEYRGHMHVWDASTDEKRIREKCKEYNKDADEGPGEFCDRALVRALDVPIAYGDSVSVIMYTYDKICVVNHTEQTEFVLHSVYDTSEDAEQALPDIQKLHKEIEVMSAAALHDIDVFKIMEGFRHEYHPCVIYDVDICEKDPDETLKRVLAEEAEEEQGPSKKAKVETTTAKDAEKNVELSKA